MRPLGSSGLNNATLVPVIGVTFLVNFFLRQQGILSVPLARTSSLCLENFFHCNVSFTHNLMTDMVPLQVVVSTVLPYEDSGTVPRPCQLSFEDFSVSIHRPIQWKASWENDNYNSQPNFFYKSVIKKERAGIPTSYAILCIGHWWFMWQITFFL